MNDDLTQEQKDELIKGKPFGHVINRGPVETKGPIFGLKHDPENHNCYMVLMECFGSGMWLRYNKWDIVLD